MQRSDSRPEARRAMEICNACRYCEGYCAVFPAMELRRAFTDGDLDYLANLCHNCRGCYFACQYAPPHEFNINLPKTFAELRMETYTDYAWPGFLGRLFHNNGLIVSITLVVTIAVILLLTMGSQPIEVLTALHTGPGAFYAVIPMTAMVGVAGISFGLSLIAMTVGAVRFWRRTGGGTPGLAAVAGGLRDVLTLKNLGGGGHGCNDIDEGFSTVRRAFHHFMFYGFLLCFAATLVAAIYDHFLDLPAPYPFWSWPVQLGTWGGAGMLIGTFGLFTLRLKANPEPASPTLAGADTALLFLLAATAATGLVLLAFRTTPAMGILLAVHLGCVLALFLSMPYSRFVHGIYRATALVRNAREQGLDGQREPVDPLHGQTLTQQQSASREPGLTEGPGQG